MASQNSILCNLKYLHYNRRINLQIDEFTVSIVTDQIIRTGDNSIHLALDLPKPRSATPPRLDVLTQSAQRRKLSFTPGGRTAVNLYGGGRVPGGGEVLIQLVEVIKISMAKVAFVGGTVPRPFRGDIGGRKGVGIALRAGNHATGVSNDIGTVLIDHVCASFVRYHSRR